MADSGCQLIYAISKGEKKDIFFGAAALLADTFAYGV